MKFSKMIIAIFMFIIFVINLVGCGGKKNNNSSSDGMSVSGSYKDGEYIASANDYDDQGFKSTVKVIVKDGEIASIDCNALAKEGDSKKVQSENGTYSMKPAGAKAEWHEQIAKFEAHVRQHGADSVKTNSEGRTDTVTGCTIKVKEYVDLINQALEKAKK